MDEGRRKLLNLVKFVPAVWTKPVIEHISLPVHAQMSPVSPPPPSLPACVQDTSITTFTFPVPAPAAILNYLHGTICPRCEVQGIIYPQTETFEVQQGPYPVVVAISGTTGHFYYHVAPKQTIDLPGNQIINGLIFFRCPGYVYVPTCLEDMSFTVYGFPSNGLADAEDFVASNICSTCEAVNRLGPRGNSYTVQGGPYPVVIAYDGATGFFFYNVEEGQIITLPFNRPISSLIRFACPTSA